MAVSTRSGPPAANWCRAGLSSTRGSGSIYPIAEWSTVMPKGPGIIDGVVQPGYDHLGRYYDAEHGLDDGRRLRRGTRDAVRRRDARPEGDWELPPRSRPDDIASFDRRHRFSGSRRRSDVRTM